ncbi:unnamed protein product [Auanema sp. JU1783]|nr:unnamed protein product [Auanema sp. JU1783]
MPLSSIELLGVTDSTEDARYAIALRKTAGMFAEAVKIFDETDDPLKHDWKLKTETKGNKCYNKHFPVGKVYCLTKEFPLPAQTLFEHHWNEIEKTPEWNPNVQHSKREHVISENADIIHYATSDVVVVKGRDFVVCRMWRKFEESWIVAASSFDTDIPVLPKKKRGFVNVCSGRFRPHPQDANKTILTYLVCVDLKDKLMPKAVISSGIAEMTIKDASYALKFIEEEKKKEENNQS